MGNIIIFKVMLFSITLIALCIINTSSQQAIKNLGLNRGDICREDPNIVFRCIYARHCRDINESIITRNYLDICGFVGFKPIVCCPILKFEIINTTKILKNKNENPILANKHFGKYSDILNEQFKREYANARITDRKCYQYIKSAKNDGFIVDRCPRNEDGYAMCGLAGGTETKYKEFPHMALIGYGNTTEYGDDWRCGGSLISERWILTAAHCQQSSGNMARWARLGVRDRVVKKDNKIQPKDYRIVHHVIHPDYKPPSLYNDIALFRLERDVEFFDAVRPICLNTDLSITPFKQIALGWGRISTAGPLSDHLLKVDLDIFSTKQCNKSYFSNNNPKLQFGILRDSMICAGSVNGEKDSCSGDSGGPLQSEHVSFDGMYIQYGITSFGKFCGDKDTPGIYTRVAKYISWIEEIAFSNAN